MIIKKYVEDYWKGEAEMILVGLISKLVIILTIIAGQLKSWVNSYSNCFGMLLFLDTHSQTAQAEADLAEIKWK